MPHARRGIAGCGSRFRTRSRVRPPRVVRKARFCWVRTGWAGIDLCTSMRNRRVGWVGPDWTCAGLRVMSIVAPVMALGVRMLRAPMAVRCLDDFRRREVSDRRMATVAADAPWRPGVATGHRHGWTAGAQIQAQIPRAGCDSGCNRGPSSQSHVGAANSSRLGLAVR